MPRALELLAAAFVGGFVGAASTEIRLRVRLNRLVRQHLTPGKLCKFCLLPDGHTEPHEVQRPAPAPACNCRCIDCRNDHHDNCPVECRRIG